MHAHTGATCVRPPGHRGMHVAWTDGGILAWRWYADYTVLRTITADDATPLDNHDGLTSCSYTFHFMDAPEVPPR